MAYNNGIDGKALLDEISKVIDAAANQYHEAGEDAGEEFVQGVVDGVKKHSKDAKSEITKIFEDFNKTTNNFKSRKSISNAEWGRVLGLSKELMKSERYVDSIREKLSDISVTFKGTGKISGIDKILDEFEKGSTIESVLWSEASKNYKKKKPAVRQPKAEVPVVSVDPVPVVKAEEKKREAIEDTTAAIVKQGEVADKTSKKMVNMAHAVRRYNKLMEDLGYDFATTESYYDAGNKVDAKEWTLKDLVKRAKMYLDTYYEEGHSNYELKNENAMGRKVWESETKKLQRFIASYEPYVDVVQTTVGDVQKATAATKNQTDALHDQAAAAEGAAQAQKKLNDAQQAGSTKKSLEEDFASQLKALHGWRDLAEKVKEQIRNSDASNTREIRKNVLSALNGVPDDVASLIGDGFVAGLRNGFKGVKTQEILDMIHPIVNEAGKGTFMGAPITEMFELLDGVDLNNFNINDILEQAKQAPVIFKPMLDILQKINDARQSDTGVTDVQTDAMRKQESAAENVAKTIEQQNKVSISSYQDLYEALKKVVELSKQLKPEHTTEYSDMMDVMGKASYPDSKEALIASIKAQYGNVQRIKASIKNGLSVYKDIDGDGYEATYNIDQNTLKDAENMLHGYIYQAVEYFGYTVADAMNDFDKKRIRTFVEKTINQYLAVSDANDACKADAEVFNAPIREVMDSITDTIMKMVTDAKNIERVLDALSGFKDRPEGVNRYTLSAQANYIGSAIGIDTPYDEIRANAKKIESYEELCEIVARYNELQKEAVIFGGTQYAGLDETEEMERQLLRARLEATGGKDVYKLAGFYGFDNIDKLASALGIKKQETAASDSTAKDTKTIGKQLLELENITGMTVTEVLSDYDSLDAGIKEKVNSILQSIGLMNDQLEFTFSKSRGGNAKAILGENFVILQKAIEANGEYAENLIGKLQEAQKLGINVAPIMERVFSNVPDESGFLSNNLYKPGYEIQARASGKDIHTNQRAAGAKDLNKALEENRIILSATDEQLIKFINDYIQLDKLGVKIDPNPFNFLYDAEKGFSFIDLSLKRTEEQAKSTQEVFRELATVLANIVGFNALGQDSNLGISSGQVIAKVAEAFERAGLASRSELDQWVKERYDGFGNIYDGYTGKTPNMQQVAESAEQSKKSLQDVLELIDKMSSESGDSDAFNKRNKALIDRANNLTSGADYDQLYSQLIENENKYQKELEETNRINKERESQLEAYTIAAASFLGDSKYDSVTFDDKNKLFENFGNKIMQDGLSASDAMDQLYLSTEKLIQQSKEMPDDIIESFGAEKEHVVETVSQLQKLSSIDLTRIFGSVDLKGFLQSFNIDKEHFSTFRTLFEELMQITKAMADGVDVGNAFDVKMEEVTNTIMRLGGQMVDLDDGSYATSMQDFYKHMSKTVIQFNDKIKADYTKDEWKALCGTYKNRLTSDPTKGIASDSLYKELNGLFPSLFPDGVLSQQDQFKLIVEKLDEARQLQANNWKILQGFEIGARDGIQANVDDMYNKMSSALFIDESAESLESEVNAFKDVAQSAEKAANAKSKFDKANQKVKKGADASANSLDDEADSMARISAASPPDPDNWDTVTQYKEGDNDEPSAIRRSRTFRTDDSSRQIVENLSLNDNGEWETTGSTQTDNYRIVRQEELNALYKDREHCLGNILKYTKEIDRADTEAGRDAAREVLELEQERLATINDAINSYGDLVSQHKLDVQDENLIAKTRDHEQKQYIDLTEDDRVEAVNEALQRRQAILNNVAKLEKQRNGASSERERDAINAIIASEQERARIVSREIDLYNSVNAAQKVQQQDAKLIEKARQQQQQKSIADTKRVAKEQAELIGKTYDEYLAAQKNIQKFNLDLSGKDHTDQLVNEQQKMAQAQEKLKDLGVDVAKIGDSDVLTLQQKSKLLEKESKQRQDIHDLIVKASDAERDAQKKSDTKAISFYQKTYDSELKALKNIETVARSFGDDKIGSVLQGQIASYKSIVSELDGLNAKLKETPTLAGDENFTQHYDDVALKAKNARIEIEGIFKESKKLQNIGSLVATSGDDVSQLQDKKVAMAAFANEVFEGKVEIKGFNQEGTQMYATLNRGADAVENITVAFDRASGKLQAFNTGTSRATDEWKDFKNQAVAGAKNLIGMYVGFQEGVQAVRTGLNYVKEIDLAMTELKKVTDETDESYKQFLEDAGSTSAVIGSTISDFTEATATFARLGYSMEEASSMAETAIIYKNVADGLDSVEESSDSIISTMMAFGIEANDTMSIIDRFNAVGNAFAITSAGIGEALQRSASALFAAGNTIDESIALVTAANSVIQNPEQVGTALKTLSLRIRGVKTELENAGLETEGMAENTAQLQAKLKALTHGKVDIMLDATSFKSTVQILREMSEAWKDMNDIERASALELIGGKRQANILSSVITNFETVEDVITTSMNSSGSAMAENEKWLDSIEGKTYQFTNALQTMWSNILDSEVVKSFIDFGTDAIQLLDTGAGKVIALVAAIKLASKIKGFSIKGIAQGLGDTIKNITTAQQTLQSLASNPAMKIGKGYDLTNVNAYAQAVSNLTAKQQANLLASQGLNREQIRYALTLNQVDDAAQREALAHVKATTAKKQSASADRALFQEKMAFAAQSLAMEAEATGSATKQAAADFLKANASKAVTAEQMKELISTSNLTAAEKAEALATVQQTTANHGLAASIKAIYTASPVGFWITLVSTVLTLIPAIGQVVDAFTKSAEEIKQEAEEISKAYEEAANEVNNNLKTLGVDGDVSSIEKLEKEFASLTAGVDRYGNNLSLTSDQYERYKELCEQIVDINPYIAKGYDSATEAIGNNAGALSQLIELQKIQQRNAVKELISDSNLETIAGATFADIDKYKKDNPLPYGDTKWDFGVEFKNALSGMEGIDDYGLFKKFTDAYNLDFDWNDYGSSETNHMTFGQDYMDAIIADLRSSNSILSEYFDKEHFDNLLSIAEQYDNNISQYNDKINEFKDSLIDTLLQVPYGEESYDKLDSSSKGFIADWIKNSEIFKIDPNATEDEINAQLESNIKTIQEFVNKFADENVQAAIGALKKIDESSVTAREHLDQVRGAASTIWNAIGGESNTYGVKSKVDIEKMLGVDAEAEIKKWSDAITSIQGYLGDKIDVASQFNYQNMTRQQMSAFLGIDWDAVGAENIKSVHDVWNKIRAAIAQYEGAAKTYSALSESVTNYKDLLSQTKEIISDNTAITQEYKDSLLELGISEDDLNECLDENNGLIVKNAKALNKLVKEANKNISANVKLAKSNARLEYYNLYKEMRALTNGRKVESETTLAQINAIYQEMSALQKTITQYSMLEHKLLGAANAYDELAKAQEIDEAIDYGSKAEEMISVVANAFNTAELGTEAAQAAIKGIIPDDVIDKTKTLDEQMQSIYDYFTDGTVSKLFSIEFDDDGGISGVEMTKKNIESFTKSLIGSAKDGAVFQGTWDEFTLNPAITSLKEFADAIGATEEVAFAYLTSLEKYDISWLGGDNSTLLDQLLGNDFEYYAQKNIESMADIEYQLANGKISIEEYQKQMYGLNGQLDSNIITQEEYDSALEDATKRLEEGKITAQEYIKIVGGLNGVQHGANQMIRDNAVAWYEASQEIDSAKSEVNRLTNELEALKTSGATTQEIQVKRDELEKALWQLSDALKIKYKLQEPTPMTLQLALDDIQEQIDIWKAANSQLTIDVLPKLQQDGEGKWTIPADVKAKLDDNEKAKIQEYLGLVNDQYTITVLADQDPNDSTAELDEVKTAAEAAQKAVENIPDPKIDVTVALNAINDLKTAIESIEGTTVDIHETTHKKTVYSWGFEGWNGANGTAHANGSAYANGNWGTKKSETALVGELGPEIIVDPKTSRWHTVGDHGAEFTQVPRGSIIFNHKQTESLLKNGYVAGRGKLQGGSAFASGTAYPGGINTWDDAYNKVEKEYSNKASDSLNNAAKNVSSASGSMSDAADEFREVFDWIEVRLEEINEDIDLRNAQLENEVGHSAKNKVVDKMIDLNQKLYDNLIAGKEEYYEYSRKLLAKVPSEYRKAAQDGAIAIEAFVGKVDEKTLESIKEYREWVQKGDAAAQQAEEVLTEISSLAKQAIDNIATQFDNEASIRENKSDQLDAYNALLETVYGTGSEDIYKQLIGINETNIKELEKQRDAMQKQLDAKVEAGNIEKYSQNWYDAVNDIAALDTEIIELKTNLNDLQDSINEIHWYYFDLLMSQFESISDEAENLIDILTTKDVVDEMGNWTDEGITALGLYAQQMEVAQKQSEQYAEQIDYLNSHWEELGYTEEEYLDKLDELKSGQYDAIKSYNDAKDAIVDLNSERIDAIKEGIEKEIEAYEELIDKKKEELDAEKDLYDFQKSVMEQEKDIADLERQLAALSGDNSASARAKRAQLEAELAEAQAALEESYYERSISNQQEALDKELESFQEEKDAEIEGWETYLEDTERVVADSLAVVQANTDTVLQTLNAMGDEYSLNITDSLISPWENGSIAISDYQTTFGNAVSETMDMLDELSKKHDEVSGAMAEEIENQGKDYISDVNGNISEYQSANEKQDQTPSGGGSGSGNEGSSTAGLVSSLSGYIRYGNKGDNVKKLQQALNDLGYGNSGTSGLDGIFGDKTLAAVKKFQKDMGISADGIVGPNTKKKFKAKGYAKGSMGVDADQWALIDELGEELRVVPGKNGRLEYIKKGTGIIPADLTERLVDLAINPQNMLDQNRPQVKVHPEIHNTQIQIDASVAELIHIDHCDQSTLPDVEKIVNKALDKHMQNLNQSIRKYRR